MRFSPETHPIIEAQAPVEQNAFTTCNYISLKNAKGVYILTHSDGGGHTDDLTLTVLEATNIAAGDSTAITTGAEFPIWVNTDTATSDTMVRQTDALTYVIDNASSLNQIVVFYIDAAILSAGFDCIALFGAGGNALNFASAVYILDGARYQQTTPPTAITN